jgi:hypothetical protein
MAEHPHVTLIRGAYAAFAKGDLDALDDVFAEDIRWHEPGRNQLSGTYDGRTAVYELFGRLMEVTEGSFRSSSVRSSPTTTTRWPWWTSLRTAGRSRSR